jgi:hypothetical protein
VAVLLRSIPAKDHLPLLAYLEQRAKQGADFEALRDIRAYRSRLGLKT